jgi:hypothetical protein
MMPEILEILGMSIRSILLAGASIALLSTMSHADTSVIFRATSATVEEVSSQLSFTPVTGLLIGQRAVSAPASYSGPSTTATASDGELRICSSSDCADAGNAGWSTSGMVSTGKYVQLRRAGPTVPNQQVAASVSVSGLVAVFTATASSAAPSLDAFDDVAEKAATTVLSGLSTFRGQMGGALTITGGEYLLCKGIAGCGSYTTAAGSIDDGDTVRLRAVTPSAFGTSKSVSLSAGSVTRTWSVSSIAKDVVPDPLTFTAQTNVVAASLPVTAIIPLVGHDGVTLTVSGAGSPAYRVCADATCSTGPAWVTGSTTVAADLPTSRSWVQLRMTAGASGSVAQVATLSADGASVGSWSVTSQSVANYSGAYASGTLPDSTRKIVFLALAANTSITTNEQYKAACESHGFDQNMVNTNSPTYISAGMVNTTKYYTKLSCSYLGAGNGHANSITGFANSGLPIGVDFKVLDRGCGNYGPGGSAGTFTSGISTTDTIRAVSANSFAFVAGAWEGGAAKTVTVTSTTVLVCQMK